VSFEEWGKIKADKESTHPSKSLFGFLPVIVHKKLKLG